MARIYYVDAAIPVDRKKRGEHKMHAVFDGDRVFRVKKLTELEDVAEIYIDALFPQIYGELMELLRRGVKVYLLKDTTKLKKLRIENNLKKSDENDAMLLSRIPREAFRLLTIEEMELKVKIRPLINRYERLVRWKKRLKMLVKDGYDYNFKEVIRLMETDRTRISREIIGQVASLPVYGEIYRKACEILGLKRSAELAILAIELPLHLPMVKLKTLLGLIPGGDGGRYNHRLRGHIKRLAVNLYINAKKDASISDKVIEVVNCLPKKRAISKLEVMILKTLRIAYLMTTNPLAGGQ